MKQLSTAYRLEEPYYGPSSLIMAHLRLAYMHRRRLGCSARIDRHGSATIVDLVSR